jgi:hypothetical protein
MSEAMQMIGKLTFGLICALAAGGCSTLFDLATLKPARFNVELSPLDYVQFVYVPGQGSASNTVTPVRIELGGSGYLEKLSGSSPRVLNPFWSEARGSAWSDLRQDHVVLSGAQTEAVFQKLVDAGFFARGGADAHPIRAGAPRVRILASINGRKNLVLTGEAPFLNIVTDLLSRF